MKIQKYQKGNVLNPYIQEWGNQWKERLQPSASSKVLLKWNASGRKPKPETSLEYTNRRIKEETKRTWRSNAADIAHGIGEGVLALNPYTAIPYYGAKVGQDIINGNVGWQTAVNASIPLFHLSPQAVGLKEATNVALEDAANSGSKTARNWRVAREIKLATRNKPNIEAPKPIIRTKVGDIEIDNPNLLYHLDRGNSVGAFSNQGAYVENGVLFPGVAKKEGLLGYSWWNKGKPYATSINGQPMTRLMTATKDTPGMLLVRSQNYPIGQWTGSKGFVLPSEYVNSEGVNVSGSVYNWKPGYGYKKVTQEPSTSLKFFERKPARISEAERAGIPKGERNLPFKAKIPKITVDNATSITPEQWTAAQDAAIARGDMVEAQRLRDLHFKVSAPNTKVKEVVFNGSLSDKPFYEFNTNFRDAYWGGRDDYTTGAWFGTGDENTLLSFAGDNPNRLKKFYLNFSNPFIKDAGYRRWDKLLPFNITEEDIAIEAAKLREKGFPEYVIEDWKNGLKTTTDNYALKLETTDYDSGIIKNVYENKAHPDSEYGVITDYIAAKPNQIKSADAVTYDDNGVRIPLGKRDNFNINDTRYGLLPFILGGSTAATKMINNLKQGGKMNNVIQRFKERHNILKSQLGTKLKNTFFNVSDRLGLGDKSDWKRMYSDLLYLGILPDNSNDNVQMGVVNPAISKVPTFKSKIAYSKRVEDVANRAVGSKRGLLKLQEAFATNDARHANSGTSRIKNRLVSNVYLNLHKYPLFVQNAVEKEKLKLARRGMLDANTKESELIKMLKPKLIEIADKFGHYKKGGSIYIKPSKRGSFTKYCNGKVTNECIARGKRSPSAAIRKKATFAQNARRWSK